MTSIQRNSLDRKSVLTFLPRLTKGKYVQRLLGTSSLPKAEAFTSIQNRGRDLASLPTSFLGYAAGFIDGEGSINCTEGSSGQLRVRMNVSNSNEDVIRLFERAFKGHVVTSIARSGTRMWQWVVNGQDAVAILEFVSPYLVVKKTHAKVAKAIVKTYNKNRGMKLPTKTIVLRLKLAEMLRRLNHGQTISSE